ncbi:uncharacterized protein LOC132619266 isoform X4 [Lycium barbarum]|uniref:uncharacterized protein LOC132619266 isoform X4 n=1 Tax=Lycium barbarum TaxID=112863 RepID=UPI00293E5F33|nr:uncharacterized protein LOC132619266 isoform X4 [Lycium barbarum]XP_060190191.1 uncharacterized protein LOC132619266 isoform X4 [Lycium barbarum]XP_060190192.1 uncharacterized protein LOC132619266 isoform X4 [Lycium barbarum]XP_060190193.1 uncharacterized protein LOC132619266 isoform X4 [Lycium barbarum]
MLKNAEAFAAEANVINPMDVVIKSPEGFLAEWWNVFFDIHSENAQESYAEAAQTMDNVVPYIPSAVPTFSPHSARPAHNISTLVPAFRPERSQDKCHLLTPDDEVTSNLKSLETDLLSQRVPFVTDSRFQICLNSWRPKNELCRWNQISIPLKVLASMARRTF